ncbi:RHS repeat protein, partial [Candidatus Symbiopectobacterium sp. NZEC135]|nr:RHS repeat protein [Candidatus Symbiopectobacterium sp. NZEC135]
PNERHIYWFDDTYKGTKRLNILGHGRINDNGKGEMSLLLEGKPDRVDGADLKYMYDYHYRAETLAFYQHIRVISCYSADGSNPLGQQIANAFKRETKAFSGYVDSLSPESIKEKKFDRAFKSEGNTPIDLNRLLTNTGRSFVRKTLPKEPEKRQLWSGYHPVKFKPQ